MFGFVDRVRLFPRIYFLCFIWPASVFGVVRSCSCIESLVYFGRLQLLQYLSMDVLRYCRGVVATACFTGFIARHSSLLLLLPVATVLIICLLIHGEESLTFFSLYLDVCFAPCSFCYEQGIRFSNALSFLC